MNFSTPENDWFYLGLNTGADPGDELFGLALGRLYLGYYAKPHEIGGWASGVLDENGVLKERQ